MSLRLFITGRLTPSRSRAEAFAHMRSVHGPMVYDPPPDAGPMPSGYAQNHGLADEIPGRWRCDRDFVTEIDFDDFAHLRAATQTPYYLDKLRPDEANFVDLPSVRTMLAQPGPQRGEESPEAVRLFLFLKRAEGAAAEDFARAIAPWGADASVRFRESAESLRPPAGPPPFADRVEMFSFVDRTDALAFARTWLASPAPPPVEAGASFAVLADRFTVARLKRGRA